MDEKSATPVALDDRLLFNKNLKITKIQDIPRYEKLVGESLACKIVRRKIKSLADGSERFEFTSDPKVIKKFLKRQQAVASRRTSKVKQVSL